MATPSTPPVTGDPAFSAIRYLPTNEAYDRWAAVYDTDGNFLQALDDIEMKTLFPRFLAAVHGQGSGPRGGADGNGKKKKKQLFVDLGCGTGRNTALLLASTPPDADADADAVEVEVLALDSSQGMLDVARRRLLPTTSNASTTTTATRPDLLRFEVYDMLRDDDQEVNDPTTAPTSNTTTMAVIPTNAADGVISTLVVEHVPLRDFFRHASGLLRPGGVLLLTNLHAHMGGISQAGFVDAGTGEKIRPSGSYAHGVREVVEEAGRWGLDVVVDGDGDGDGGDGGDIRGKEERTVRGIREVAVEEDMVEALGVRSKKWVGVTCWFGGLFRKREGKNAQSSSC